MVMSFFIGSKKVTNSGFFIVQMVVEITKNYVDSYESTESPP
jgi:hypothetical protein